MVDIRGKLADVNDDKEAHSLSTKNVHFCAFAGVRKHWRDICWQWFGKSWSSLRGEEKDDCFSSHLYFLELPGPDVASRPAMLHWQPQTGS